MDKLNIERRKKIKRSVDCKINNQIISSVLFDIDKGKLIDLFRKRTHWTQE